MASETIAWQRAPSGTAGGVIGNGLGLPTSRPPFDATTRKGDFVTLLHPTPKDGHDVVVHVFVRESLSNGQFRGEVTGFEPASGIGSVIEHEGLALEEAVEFSPEDVRTLTHGAELIGG